MEWTPTSKSQPGEQLGLVCVVLTFLRSMQPVVNGTIIVV